jgi:DNA modification methylase
VSIADVLAGRRQWWIEQAHVLDGLRLLPDESVNCVVTSPPYWGLRAYGTDPQIWGGDPECAHGWGDAVKRGSATRPSPVRKQLNHANAATRQPLRSAFCAHCGAWRGELGSEPTIALFVEHLVQVFCEVRRVLRTDGVCFLNIGDSYAGSGRGPSKSLNLHNPHSIGVANTQQFRNGQPPIAQPALKAGQIGKHWTPVPEGLKAKDACLIPFRLAIALQDDGWWVRQPIIWSKPNPMPESAKDRCTTSHEYIFHLTKSRRYVWDAAAIAEPVTGNAHARGNGVKPKAESEGRPGFGQDDIDRAFSRRRGTVPTPRQSSIRRPAGWQEGEGSHDVVPAGRYPRSKQNASFSSAVAAVVEVRNARSVWEIPSHPFPQAHFATFPPELARRCILAGCPEGGVVLDPFSGSGTTVMVALRHGRRGIGLELQPNYVDMARERVVEDAPLLNGERSEP